MCNKAGTSKIGMYRNNQILETKLIADCLCRLNQGIFQLKKTGGTLWSYQNRLYYVRIFQGAVDLWFDDIYLTSENDTSGFSYEDDLFSEHKLVNSQTSQCWMPHCYHFACTAVESAWFCQYISLHVFPCLCVCLNRKAYEKEMRNKLTLYSVCHMRRRLLHGRL